MNRDIDESLILKIRRSACLARKACTEDQSLDVKGVVWLEHINIVVGSRDIAEIFYFQGLGLTRDPVKDVGRTMWANVGPRQQLHLVDASDTSPAQTVNGHIGLALPDIEALRVRLASVSAALQGTLFKVKDCNEFIAVMCPWGNLFSIFCSKARSAELDGAPAAKVRRTTKMAVEHTSVDQSMAVRGQPGIRFLHLACSSAQRVGQFYKDVFDCCIYRDSDMDCAICVGPSVHLIFDSQYPDADVTDRAQQARGIHICIYISEFKKAYEVLQKKGVIWTNPRFVHLDTCDSFEEASASRQFRFRSIRDDQNDAEELVELEHETRSLRHLQFMKDVHYVAK